MWWILSGLGGDHRLFQSVRLPAPHRHLPWPCFRGCRSMSDFAQRALALGIAPGDRLIGASFGGMLAAEIAALMPIRQVILIGSTTRPSAINRLAIGLGRFLRHAPGADIQQLVGPLAIGPKRLAVRMFQDSDPAVMTAMFDALRTWRGARPRCPVQRLHGRLDPVIPVRGGARYDHLLWASHLVPIERPAATSACLARWCGVDP